MKINCVILNFNDAETTADLVRLIHDYDYLEGIVVVDNASTDDSMDVLEALQDEKVTLIRAHHNGGYGAGNNLGVRYAMEHNGATHIVIANPDVVFTEKCIIKMAKIFENHPDAGIVAASVQDDTMEAAGNGWRLHGFMGELLSMGPVSRRLSGRFLNYPKSHFKDKKAVYVDVVHGSMLMVSAQAFIECGGYDQGIFLYQEEAVLGTRMRTAGYRTILLLNQEYQHQHSVSISKSYSTLMERQKLRNESVMYYMKHYLYINKAQECFARLWFAGILAEIAAAGIIKKAVSRKSTNV